MRIKGSDVQFKDFQGIFPLYLNPDSEGEDSLNMRVIHKFEKQTGLVFLSGEEEKGNVCMANSREVLPAFRTSFSLGDLLNYTKGILVSQIFLIRQEDSSQNLFPYPQDSDFFWEQSLLGSRR